MSELGVSWADSHDGPRPSAVRVRRLMAGKFHRYSGWKFSDYFRYFSITVKDLIFGNILGFFGFLGGLIMSFCRLVRPRTRPDVIFLKGGYTCLPVGLIARLFRIPYIVHESDSVAGLANRLLMKHATKVAFGMPPSNEVLAAHSNYIWTGIPVGAEFKSVSPTRMESLKRAFSFSPSKPLVVITGGSQGAEALNEATRDILPELLKFTQVGLVAGRKHYEDMIDLKKYENWDHASLESDFRMWEFNTTMSELLGAADVIVSRAGATTIAEMAALKKATLLVPYERLPGSHQVKNAERLVSAGAAVMIKNADIEVDPTKLLDEIRRLIRSPRLRATMADKLHAEARADAAKRLAEIIITEAA